MCVCVCVCVCVSHDVFYVQQDLMSRNVCTETEATEIVNKNCIPLVGEQQRKFEKTLESFDVSHHFAEPSSLYSVYSPVTSYSSSAAATTFNLCLTDWLFRIRLGAQT